jgi:hypothetical protein
LLSITANALDVITKVSEHPTLDPESGVRIARRETAGGTLDVRAVHGPRPGDHVFEKDGARLFVGPEVEHRLDGRLLDARTEAGGRVQFVLQAA